MSTPARETSQIIVEIPIETKRKLERMKFLKGILQNQVVPQAVIDGVDEKYEEVFRKKEKGTG